MARGEERKPYGIFRTLATSVVLSCLVTIAALIYLTSVSAPSENRVGFILSFILPFGIVGAILGCLGILSLNDVEKEGKRKLLLIDGCLAFLFSVTAGVLGIAILKDVTIGVCLIGLGICEMGITVVAFLSRKDKDQ